MFCFGFRSASEDLFARARAARPAAREATPEAAPVCEAAGSSPAAAAVFAHYADEEDATGDEILDRLIAAHGSDPMALAQAARPLDGAHRNRLDAAIALRFGGEVEGRFLRSLRGADDVCQPPPGFTPPLPVEKGAVARAHELIAEIQLALLPAYHRAVGAGDAAAALELAMAIERGVRDCARLDADPGVHVALALVRARLSVELGPQMLGGAPVRGELRAPGGKDPDATAAGEAAQTVALLATAEEIERDVGFDGVRCGAPSAAGLAAAAAKVEAWRGRPADFHFLVALLSRKGVWGVVSGARAASGRSGEELLAKVDAQAAATGELVNVGGYDDDQAAAALAPQVMEAGFLGKVTLPPSEEKAQEVFAMIASASPDGRVAIVKRLAATGRLASMTDHLPLEQVRELMRALGDWDARLLLSQAVAGRGGEVSTTKVLEDAEREEDEAARADNEACNDGDVGACFGTGAHALDAFGLFAMRQIYHLGTFGLTARTDPALDALGRGEISPDAFGSEVTKAALVSGATFALTALTAGTAGSFVTEALEELGAGRTLAEIIGAGAGGGAAGITDRAVHDVARGELSDVDAYLDAGGGGAVGGLLIGTLGAGAQRYLPPSERPAYALAGAEGAAAAEGERDLGLSFSRAQREVGGGGQVARARTRPEAERTVGLEELDRRPREGVEAAFERRAQAIAERDAIEAELAGKRLGAARRDALEGRHSELLGEINEHSRQMGEIAAEGVMKQRGGRKLYPTDKAHSTKGDFDQIWEVDGQLELIEAKGGSSELGTRKTESGQRAEQGSRSYAFDIARNMKEHGATKEIRQLGRRIERELTAGNVRYRLVRAPIGQRQGADVPRDIEMSEFDMREP